MDFVPTLSLHSWPSRSFTKQERTQISRLFHAIVSSRLLPSLLSGCAMPLTEGNGAVAVAVQPYSGSTLAVITHYGMLLLSLQDALDAFTVESLMSFIRGYMGEASEDMMRDVNTDNPMSAEAKGMADANRVGELEEQEKMLYALREIAESSEDAESVRVAFIVLSTTTIGRMYLEGNPIKL